MKYFRFRLMALVALLGAGIVVLSLDRSTMLAVEGGQYVLDSHVFGFGGGVSSGGAYEVNSTIGQANADELTGGDYSMGGGFWGGGARVVAQVTPTETPTATATPTPTATATATTPGDPSPTATATATATTPGATPSTATPTATATTPGGSLPTATATPTVPGNTGINVRLYLPLVER